MPKFRVDLLKSDYHEEMKDARDIVPLMISHMSRLITRLHQCIIYLHRKYINNGEISLSYILTCPIKKNHDETELGPRTITDPHSSSFQRKSRSATR